MVMFARQMGQPRARLYTSSAQDEQTKTPVSAWNQSNAVVAWGRQTDFAVVFAVAVCGRAVLIVRVVVAE